MTQRFTRFALLTLLFSVLPALTFSQDGKGWQLKVSVNDKTYKEPIIMATVSLGSTGLTAVTDIDGVATISNVPAGDYQLTISYVGYEPVTSKIKVSKNLDLHYTMTETSLQLKEVNVVARRKEAGAATSYSISRQAIDHMQAASLADVFQLLPGQIIGNRDLTSQTNLQLRTLTNNSTAAFGSSIIVDGIPMSNNGELSAGGFSASAFTGTDLRQVAADNIDEVEVVEGIPSAEYGDLTSGLVVVHSKTGVTPLQVKAKINPELQNYSVGKGLNIGGAGVLNFSFDYAKAWGDPRSKTRSYGRYTFTSGWGYNPTRKWHMETKLNLMYNKDWTGNDPDARDDGTYTNNHTSRLSLSHTSTVQVEKPLMRTLTVTGGLTVSRTKNTASSYVATTTGLLPVLTALETGYWPVSWMTTSYLAQGITESKPGNVFLKANDAFFARSGKVSQNFKVGLEYHYDWNSGRGYYNGDETRPYRANNNGRPRAFSDVPGLHQMAAYAEDNFNWEINETNRLRVNVGVRFTAQQPFSNVSTTALSPRVNASFAVTRWLTLRAGFGMNSKTPGLNYLYPDRKYEDRVAANYMPQDDAAAQLLVYHTQVYDVKKSRGLKNATTTKFDAGIDIKLPKGGSISLVGYYDRTPNGYSNATDYYTYFSDVFTASQGLVVTPGQATTVDYGNPARHDLVFTTKGLIGNNNHLTNSGIELTVNFPKIEPLNTTVYLSGAYNQSKTWDTGLNSSSPRQSLLPTEYTNYSLTPWKVVYPSGKDYDKYRRVLNTLNVVTNIPKLKMVASFIAQAIWYDWSRSFTADKLPIGWITADYNSDGSLAGTTTRHDINADMMDGYIGMDGVYYATAPAGQSSVHVSDLSQGVTDNNPSKNPVTWNLNARLTKELGRFGQLSFYVNNCLYYEPYLKGNNTRTLSQRNTSTFNFGAELDIKL